MAGTKGPVTVGKEDDPKPESEKKPVEVSQTIDVKNLEALIKEKMTDFQNSIAAVMPGSGEVSKKLQEILDWMKTDKPVTIEEVKKKVDETVSPSMIQRIPLSITFLGKPLQALFNKGKKDGTEKEK